MTEFKNGDHVKITCDGQSVPGRVVMMSPNQRAGALWWDAMKHEVMIGGHIGFLLIMREKDDCGYHSLIGGFPVKIEPSEPVDDTFEEEQRRLGL